MLQIYVWTKWNVVMDWLVIRLIFFIKKDRVGPSRETRLLVRWSAGLMLSTNGRTSA